MRYLRYRIRNRLHKKIGMYAKSAVTLLAPACAVASLELAKPSSALIRSLVLGFTGALLIVLWDEKLMKLKRKAPKLEKAEESEEKV